MNKEEEIRLEVVKAAKAIYNKGLVDYAEGNVSIRFGEKEEFFITPSFNNYKTLIEDEIVYINFNGEILSIGKLPSTEVKMHLAVYKDRPKVKCVIHNHSSYISMLSVLRRGIPIIMEQQLIFLGGEIRCTDITEAHTEEMGSSALKALGRNNAAILANHGAIICGKSLDHAVRFAVVLEKLAKVYWGALQIGEPLSIPEKNLAEHEKMFNGLFACYPKRLRKTKD